MDVTTPSPTPAPANRPPSQRSPPVGAKRKRNNAKFYAVKLGFKPGIYDEWGQCLAQVSGYKGAVFQGFSTYEEANAFLTGRKPPVAGGKGPSETESTRFYAIQRGRIPGVYTSWAKAQEQIKGFTRPRYKKFSTRPEAEEFVKAGQGQGSVAASFAPSQESLPGAPGMISEIPTDENGVQFEPATGPLPPGSEDGFDPNVLLDPTTGKVVYKTSTQTAATKTKPAGPPGMLRIYTDGSALKNGSAVAAAGVGVYFGPGDRRNVSESLKGTRQTNQRAELTAILRAVDIAPRHRDATIITDSRYAINCVTDWFVKWRRNNWMTSGNKPVENKDLIESILDRIEERNTLKVKTLFEWVKGHNRDQGNEEADRLAVNGAQVGISEKKDKEATELVQDVPNEAFEDDDF